MIESLSIINQFKRVQIESNVSNLEFDNVQIINIPSKFKVTSGKRKLLVPNQEVGMLQEVQMS